MPVRDLFSYFLQKCLSLSLGSQEIIDQASERARPQRCQIDLQGKQTEIFSWGESTAQEAGEGSHVSPSLSAFCAFSLSMDSRADYSKIY